MDASLPAVHHAEHRIELIFYSPDTVSADHNGMVLIIAPCYIHYNRSAGRYFLNNIFFKSPDIFAPAFRAYAKLIKRFSGDT